MTFKKWLRQQEVSNDIEGDLIFDAKRDKNMPNVNTLAELTSYLARRGVREDVLEVVENIWSEYLDCQLEALDL